MATTGKKEYTLKINGIDIAIKDVTALETAVNSLDTSLGKVSNTTVKVTGTTAAHTKALTDDEKAEQQLINTIDKVVQARSDANKAQIEANIAAREVQREVTREIQVRQQAEGSIKQMGMQLTDLRNQYEALSRTERDDLTVGNELLTQIQALDKEYKTLRESTGNFRDSVGNYEKALSGLGKVSESIEGVSKSSMGLAQGLLGANQLMAMFGNESEKSAEQAKQLQKIIALLSIAQQINTNVLKKSIVQGKLSAVTTAIQATQTKAKAAAEAASTKGTIAATVAQKIFNTVASANPYVILAIALGAVGVALFAFASNTGKAADSQKKLNDEVERTPELLSRMKEDTNFDIAFAEACGASREELRRLRYEAANTRKEVADAVYDMAITQGANTEIIKKAKEIADKAWSELLQTMRANTVEEQRERADANKKAEQDVKDRTKTAADAAKKRADTELSIVRAAEDARIKLIQNSNEQARKTLALTYDRQIEDLRKRLTTEKDLTAKARAALNETITSLEKQKGLDLKKLEEEQVNRALALQQELEDSRIALIVGNYDRQTAEVNLQYDRQIEAYKKRMDEDKTLTEKQQKRITELILNAQKARGTSLARLASEQLNQQADQQLTAIEATLKKTEDKIGEVVARSKTGLELIDVEDTRKNLADTNAALDKYITGLAIYQTDLKKVREATLADLQKGTPEYEAEMQQYAKAHEEAAQRIKKAQKQIEDNTKQSKDIQADALAELFGKIAKYANDAVAAISSVFDTWNMGLQVQLDDLNKQLDTLDERYEGAKKQREDAANNVKDLEEKIQGATGETAKALKMQLQEELQARAGAEREEIRLAKEKEKLEADIAKKEKQMRRNELLSSIAQGIAGTASAVIGALGKQPWGLWNIALAAVVGAMGAAQVGIMTNQLTKLADGGEIIGPSHANGGVPIVGTNYEVEGGEFVINKQSYGANAGLVNFINDTPHAITAADLLEVMPSNATPVVVNDASRINEERIVEAINGINFHPVVSVTDINDVSNEMVRVKDLAGF